MENKTKRTFALFLPIILELFLINLLTTVDTLMLARYDELGVDAVGTANSTLSLLTTLIIISSNGVAITVGQHLGAKKYDDAKKILAQGVIFNFILGLGIMLVFFFGSSLLLHLNNTPEEFFEYTKNYIEIYAIALPFQAVTQVINANFRAYGKPFYMTLVSINANLINVLFNWFLIFGVGPFPELGIDGAAIATVLSLLSKTLIGAILNHYILKCPLIPGRINRSIIKSITMIGAPSAFESIFYTTSQFFVTAALNKLLADEITAKIYINMSCTYTTMFSNAFGAANAIIVAVLVGAHKYDEAKSQTLKFFLIGLSFILTLVTVLVLASKFIFGLITDNTDVVKIIVTVIPLIYIQEIGRCGNLIIINAQKSAGDVIFPLVLGAICMFTVASMGAWIFGIVFKMGLAGILLAVGLDEFIRGLVSLIRWLSNKWQNKSIIKDEDLEMV